jgi:hypothetical protein
MRKTSTIGPERSQGAKARPAAAQTGLEGWKADSLKKPRTGDLKKIKGD